jgi:hypothetical protein
MNEQTHFFAVLVAAAALIWTSFVILQTEDVRVCPDFALLGTHESGQVPHRHEVRPLMDLIAPRMEPPERRMWFQGCRKCDWRSEPEYGPHEVRIEDECPDCKSASLVIGSDYYTI